jgi:pimeloyl-ACP methyl ester carboxylesterase
VKYPNHVKRAAALLGALALALSACAMPDFDYRNRAGDSTTATDKASNTPKASETATSSPSPTQTDTPSPQPTETETPDDGAIAWAACNDVAAGAQCATIEAPLDWALPDGEQIELALARIPASDQANRIGSLLINPGGPGGSGIDSLEYLYSGISPEVQGISPEVQAVYDVLAFDPRGVGQSTPISCYQTTEEQDAFWSATWPSTPEGYEASVEVIQPFIDACVANSGAILGFVDTKSAARDMDLIRQLVGDDELYYLGYSYGTQLGATYAELFPDKVGRLVLDGAVDMSLSSAEHELSQARGFEAALGAYVEDCLASALTCPLTGPKENALSQIHDMLLAIEAEPMPTLMGRDLTLPLALNGVIVPMYDDRSWYILSLALDEALNNNDGSYLLYLSDYYLDRGDDGEYTSNSMVAFYAINLLDAPMAYDLASVEAHAAALAEASPTIGEFWGYGEKIYELWPYDPVDEPHAPSAPGAKPIVVIGTTGDPATPYSEAQAMAEQLESGVLLTWEGEGHTAYGRSNDCIADAVDTYLLDGTPPAEGLVC